MRQDTGSFILIESTDSGGRWPGFDFQELACIIMGLASLKSVDSSQLETLRQEPSL